MSTVCLVAMGLHRAPAHRLAATLSELAEPAPDAVSVFEADGAWRVDAYYSARPAEAETYVRGVAELTDLASDQFRFEDVPEENWVARSQEALPPVYAGRFTVHGAHDRDRIPAGPWSIEIDAGEAFGTAHHATTYGCLIALSELASMPEPRTVLDLGTGSGVLAIAAQRIWQRADIVASDLDADAVRVAAVNFGKNRATHIRCISADGVPGLPHGAHRSYDLLIANILAGPLIAMSGAIARAVTPGGALILSGILTPQAYAVQAAYIRHGLAVQKHARIAGWSILTLQKRPNRFKPIEPLILLD